VHRGSRVQEAGVNPSAAASLGVSIDRRRQNRSQESFNLNVQRLKEYKAKLVVFPRKAKVSKQGDSSAADLGSIGAQVSTAAAFPVQANEGKTKARVITKEEKAAKVSAVLRKERTDAQRWGARLKLAAAKVLERAMCFLSSLECGERAQIGVCSANRAVCCGSVVGG
jgi:large subunit ribosomal protein L13e